MQADLRRYGIEYDQWFFESSLHTSGYVAETVGLLTEKGWTYEKDGALWLNTTQLLKNKYLAEGKSQKQVDKLDLKDDVLRRANGFYTYFAADIAYHRNKLEVRGFDKSIDVWGADHHGHVARLQAALDGLGLDGSHRLVVVLMQLVNLLQDGQPVRMSKRSGKAIALHDLLDEVSVDAARYFFNSRSATSPVDFDLDLAVREDSENPVYYVQYAHARICTLIARLAGEGYAVPKAAEVQSELLSSQEETCPHPGPGPPAGGYLPDWGGHRVLDNDSKWRQAVGEITPDYQDVLFKKGFGGILREAEDHLAALDPTNPEDLSKREFYTSVCWTSRGIIRYANRYAQAAEAMADQEKDPVRAQELRRIARNCRRVPEHPPESFYEAIQFLWFVQVGGILSENPLSLNPGRFDQYMAPYYEADLAQGTLDEAFAQELVDALWLKYSEWVWTISANTADYFAGYNQFQNLTVGGKRRDGKDGTNPVTYLALKATEEVKTHQPGLSVRVQADCPKEFLDAVTHLVSKGTGFPAIHSDSVGYQMLLNAGYAPEDARDWNNCGCVVPHSRKTFQWTSAASISFAAALEFALNEGKSRLSGEQVSVPEKDPKTFTSIDEIIEAWKNQFRYLVKQGVISLVTAQEIHRESGHRPFMSACNEYCLKNGKDLVDGGAKYNIGPVFTGVGLSVTANSLAVIKKLVFEDKKYTLSEVIDAINANWEGYEQLRQEALACPKVRQ